MSSDAPEVPTLETSRLTLRPWVEADAPDLLAAFGDAGAMRFWNAPPAATAEGLEAVIARSRGASPTLHAAWSVLLKPGGGAVGMVNYHHRDVRDGRLEIGFVLAPAHWGRGLAREAVGALLRHCFGTLGARRVEAKVSPGNAASLRLVERLGFRFGGGPMCDRVPAGDGAWMSVLTYGLLDVDWRGGG